VSKFDKEAVAAGPAGAVERVGKEVAEELLGFIEYDNPILLFGGHPRETVDANTEAREALKVVVALVEVTFEPEPVATLPDE
jgi:hypothetical protein